MTRRPQTRWAPPLRARRGPGRTYDPFYEFERAARDDGKPYKSPEPKAERQLLSLLGSNAALVVMGSLLAAVVVVLLVIMAVKL